MVEDRDIRKLLPITTALRKLVAHSRMNETNILDHLTRIGLHEYADEWERQAQELEARIGFLETLSHEALREEAAAEQIDSQRSRAA